MRKILIVCRRVEDLACLGNFSPSPESTYIAASDDLLVQECIKRDYPWISHIFFLETMDGLYSVSDDVLKTLTSINQWLLSILPQGSKIDQEIVLWARHVEGGQTTQRLQDFWLMYRSYISLLQDQNPTQILLLSESNFFWEDEVLFMAARNLHKPIKKPSSRLWEYFIWWTKLLFKAWARMFYIFGRLIFLHFFGLFWKQSFPSNLDVLFMVCSNAAKHFNDTLWKMKTIVGHGMTSGTVCWTASEPPFEENIRSHFSREGFFSWQLEAFFPLFSLPKILFSNFSLLFSAFRRKKTFYSSLKNVYPSLDLGPVLWPFIINFFIWETFQRFCLEKALINFNATVSSKAFHPWGGVSLPFGKIAWNLQANSDHRPILFNYWLGNSPKWPYRLLDDPTDFFFARGELEKKSMMENFEVPERKILVTADERASNLEAFQFQYSRLDSQRVLGISSDSHFTIFFEAGMVMRGFMSSSEQATQAFVLLQLAAQNPRVCLLIKPHPGHKSGNLEKLIERYNLKNAIFLPGKSLPFHGLNACDILITKYSTIGIEAFYFGKPVISVLLSGENQWKCFGNAASYVYTETELKVLVSALINDEGFRHNWAAAQQSAQRDFLASLEKPFSSIGKDFGEQMKSVINSRNFLSRTI